MGGAVLIPVGPGAAEPARLDDLLDSIAAHEPGAALRVIVVDDNPEPRRLPAAVDTVVRTPLWARGRRPSDAYSAMVAGTLEGLRAAAGADWVLKLDTDALVIAPFAAAVAAALDGHGVAGSYDVTCTGHVRDWSHWAPVVRRAWLPVHRAGRRVHVRSPRRSLTARRVLARARAGGYEPGEHCLGGAYAVSAALLARADLLDWRPWVGTRLGEDVVVGILARAAGLTLAGHVGPGEPFGLAYETLPMAPADLVARGHAVVHSVKDGRHGTEAELRAWFRARRRA